MTETVITPETSEVVSTNWAPKNQQVKRILATLKQCGDVVLSEKESRQISSRHGEVVKAARLEDRAELSFGKTIGRDGQRKYSASGRELLTRDNMIADLCVWEDSLRAIAKQCNGGALSADWLDSFGLVPTPLTFRNWIEEVRK